MYADMTLICHKVEISKWLNSIDSTTLAVKVVILTQLDSTLLAQFDFQYRYDTTQCMITLS